MQDPQLLCLDFVSTPVFALDVSDEGVPIYSAYNKAALAKSGYKLEDILGKTALEIYAGHGGQAAYARHLQVISGGQPYSYELSLPLAGEIRQIKTTLEPIIDERGHVYRLIGTSLDITEEKLGLESKATVDTITSEMEDFITMAAHDLRTPMRNVQHIADMLREDFTDLGDGKLDLISLMEDVALKATNLISDVLSHAQATKAPDEVVSFQFGELCQEICDILDPLGNHSIEFEDAYIVGDKTAYQIVLRNLLDNAIKHGAKRNLIVDITLVPATAEMIEVTVRDNGKGFENPGIAFLSGGKMRTDSGFGLLGIKRMVLARNGRINASTPDVGHGSEISFTLPGNFLMLQEAQSPSL